MVNEQVVDQRADKDLIVYNSILIDALIHGRESLLNALTGVKDALVINRTAAEMDISQPGDLASRLKKTLDDLTVGYMNSEGSMVDYEALRHSSTYAEYHQGCLSALRQFQPDTLPTEAVRRAFWINLYNTLVIDAVINFQVGRSVTEGFLGIMSFFRRAAYTVGGKRVSLEDIEHGILRGNRGNPYIPGPHFPSSDPRLAWVLSPDPRIHFALNCGARSCPPIQSYRPENLDDQLNLATRSFLSASVEVDPDNNRVRLSQILKWYRADFGGQKEMLEFVIRHLPADERRDFLCSSLAELQIIYAPYSWSLNIR